MKKLFFVPLLFASSIVSAQSSSSLNLQLPSTPSTYGQDSFRTGDTDCKNSIGGSTNLEFGITGIVDNAQSPFSGGRGSKDIGIFARITIPLDGPKERINCNTLYQLELKKKRLEIMKLEQELQQLRALQQEALIIND